jgi:hypothetical protein
MENNTPYELPRVEDMTPDEETIKKQIGLEMMLRESGDLDKVITKLVKTSIKLTAAFLVAQDLIEDLVEIPKEAAYKRIERATRPLWTYLLAIRVNAGVENGTDGSNPADERRAE